MAWRRELRTDEHRAVNQILRRRLEVIRTFTLAGLVAGLGAGLLLGWIDSDALWSAGGRGALIGALIGGSVGVGEELVLPTSSRRLGFLGLTLLRIAAYTAVIFATLLVVNSLDRVSRFDMSLLEAVRDYSDAGFLRDFALALAIAPVVTAVLQVRRLHNPGEIFRLLSGRYHYPEEESRVFLFADLADSTPLAERLGHLEFSNLLRDLFSDVSEAVLAWRGQVYQHVGDGVIVTWHMDDGLRKSACVECFLEMQRQLARRHDRYHARYGAVPLLRGAIHGGLVVTTWVGEAKKELAFHGDTLNATARIESMCRELDADLLVSASVFDRLELRPGVGSEPKGAVELRGKAEPVKLLSLREAAPPSK